MRQRWNSRFSRWSRLITHNLVRKNRRITLGLWLRSWAITNVELTNRRLSIGCYSKQAREVLLEILDLCLQPGNVAIVIDLNSVQIEQGSNLVWLALHTSSNQGRLGGNLQIGRAHV